VLLGIFCITLALNKGIITRSGDTPLVSAENDRDEYIRKVTIGTQKPHNGEIVLEEYNPNWPVLFESEAERIRAVLGNKVLQIHHVGSTAVPGLCAKPIIDILLVVSDSSDESSYVPDLEVVGYTLRIREPDWFQHRLLKGPDTDVNLHVFSEKTSEIEKMVLFRDWLRSHDNDRRKYENVKRELSRHIWQHVQHYADGKTAIIEEIMKRAWRSMFCSK